MVNECTVSTDKLSLGGLSKNSVVRITDHPDMTSAVYHKATNQTNNFSLAPHCLGDNENPKDSSQESS